MSEDKDIATPETVNEEIFKISYWTKKSDEALGKAEYIADMIGEGFSHGDNGMGGWYVPDKDYFLTKAKALEWIASGRKLTEIETYYVKRAIDTNVSEDDHEDWNSSTETGWMSSSSNC